MFALSNYNDTYVSKLGGENGVYTARSLSGGRADTEAGLMRLLRPIKIIRIIFGRSRQELGWAGACMGSFTRQRAGLGAAAADQGII